MKIFVRVKTRARHEGIEKIDDNHFKIAVKEPPEDGRANEAVVSALADYFNRAKSDVILISGHTSKNKLLEIDFVK